MYNVEKNKIRLEIGVEIVQRYGADVAEVGEALLLEMPIGGDFDKSTFMNELDSRIKKTTGEGSECV